VNRQKVQFGAILCLVAMVSFVIWPIWQWLSVKAVSASLRERTKALADSNPQLKAAWTIAMQDDVLTLPEAKAIVEAAGEKVDVEE
jgi:hypothetical protein